MFYINILLVILFLAYIFSISFFKKDLVFKINEFIQKKSLYISIIYFYLYICTIIISIFHNNLEAVITFNTIPIVFVFLSLAFKDQTLCDISLLFICVLCFSFFNSVFYSTLINTLNTIMLLTTLVIVINNTICNKRLLPKNILIISEFFVLITSIIVFITFYFYSSNLFFLSEPSKNLYFIFENLNGSFIAYSLLFILLVFASVNFTFIIYNKIIGKIIPSTVEKDKPDTIIYY